MFRLQEAVVKNSGQAQIVERLILPQTMPQTALVLEPAAEVVVPPPPPLVTVSQTTEWRHRMGIIGASQSSGK